MGKQGESEPHDILMQKLEVIIYYTGHRLIASIIESHKHK